MFPEASQRQRGNATATQKILCMTYDIYFFGVYDKVATFSIAATLTANCKSLSRCKSESNQTYKEKQNTRKQRRSPVQATQRSKPKAKMAQHDPQAPQGRWSVLSQAILKIIRGDNTELLRYEITA